LGRCIAGAMAGFIGNIMQAHYGIAERAHGVSFGGGLIATAIGLGVITSMVAALFPALHAARVDPVRALQRGRTEFGIASESRFRNVAAATSALAAICCLLAGHSRIVFYAGYLSFVISALLLTPTLCRSVSRLLHGLLTRLRPIEGALAADSLVQAP